MTQCVVGFMSILIIVITIVTSAVHSYQQQTQWYFWYCFEVYANGNDEGYISGVASYYGDNDFIIQTFHFIPRSDALQVTCST